MTITIVGTGNVATVLGKKLLANHYTIHQVCGRNIDETVQLALALQALPINHLNQIDDNTDVVLICVADKAIAEIANAINASNAVVLHTAGSVSIDVLKNCSNNYGVLYPIQSLRKSMDINVRIPFLIDANNNETKLTVKKIAQSISDKVDEGNDTKRLQLHTAAVFACNFVNFMYLQSANFCQANNIDFSLLQPLIEETATRLQHQHPKNVFTGPAVRKDIETINKHLQQLESNTTAYQLYKLLTEMIINEKKNE